MRRLRNKPERTMVRIHKKVERRERSREERAEKVAQIDNKIKSELLERLKQGTYGDIYNFRPEAWNEVLDDQELSGEEERGVEYIADFEDDDESQKKEEEEKFYEFGGFSSGSEESDWSSEAEGGDAEDTPGAEDDDFSKFLEEGFDSSAFDVGTQGSNNTTTTTTTTTTKGNRASPVPSKTAKAPPKTAESNKRRRSDSGKGRAGKKRKGHIEIEYDEKPTLQKETW